MSKFKAMMALASMFSVMPNIGAPADYYKDRQKTEQQKALEKKQRVREQIRARREQKGR
jgi:hypothetical protein